MKDFKDTRCFEYVLCCSMGKGAQGEVRDREQAFMWDEIRKHRNPDDTWVVLENKVYDVSNFKKRHPGGWQLLEDHAGQDATVRHPRRSTHYRARHQNIAASLFNLYELKICMLCG